MAKIMGFTRAFCFLASITVALGGCLKKSNTLLSDFQSSTGQNLQDPGQVCAQNQAYPSPSACSQSTGVAAAQTNCVPVIVTAPSGASVSCYRLPTSCNQGDPCKMLLNTNILSGIWGGSSRPAEVAYNSCMTNSSNAQSLAGTLISCQ